MKKIIAIFFFLTCSVFAQNKYQVFKNGDLVDTYIPVGSGSNSIERTYIRLQDSVLTIPYKILGDSIYARSGSLIIENVEFSNGTMTIARIITSSGITGGDTLLVDGFIETAVLDTVGADSADVLTFNGTEWVASAPTGGGGGTDDQTIDVFSISGNNLQLSLEDDGEATKTVDISSTTAVSANADSITAHRGELNTLNGYVDQDVTTTGTPVFGGVDVGDNEYLRAGDGNDFSFYHNGTNSYFYNTTGDMYFQQAANEDIYFWTNNTARWAISKAGVLYPVTTTSFDIGSSGFRVDDIYTENLDASGNVDAGGYKINTNSYSSNQTLTASQCYGSVIYVTGAATITLPAIADGMSVTIITVGAVAVSVDPNASDKLVLDGTTLDDGDKATNTSTTGDMIVLTYYSADGWYASSDGWSDGGA